MYSVKKEQFESVKRERTCGLVGVLQKHRLVEAASVLVLSEKRREKIQTEYALVCG